MEELPRSSTPVGSQAINPELLQQILVALANLQVQASQSRELVIRDPKVPDVPMFNGNKNQYAVFLARLQNFFVLQPNTYTTDSKKIGYVISRLEGSAADWAVTLIENPEYGNNSEILTNWEVFLSVFTKFSDPFLRRNATDNLLDLTQGRTQSVLSYWTKFSELLYRSDISPDSARPLFERGLRYEIRDRLVDKTLPDDLDGFVSAVVDLDNRLYRLRQDRRGSTSRVRSSSYELTQPRSTDLTTMPQPMDVSGVEIGAVKESEVNGVLLPNSKERLDEIRTMDPETRRRICVEENRCHYCKRVVGRPPVHVAQNCPFKANKAKYEYPCIPYEVSPQQGIPDNTLEGIPPRQVLQLNVVNDSPTRLFFVEIDLISDTSSTRVSAMIDSGAMGSGYIDFSYLRKAGFKTMKLKHPIRVNTVDGTACGTGLITDEVPLRIKINDSSHALKFLVIDCPKTPVILGLDWLRTYNPLIDWRSKTLKFNASKELGGTEGNLRRITSRQVSANPSTGKEDCIKTAKQVSFCDSVTVRVVKNYVRELKRSFGISDLFPANSAELPVTAAEHICMKVERLAKQTLFSEDSSLISLSSIFELVEDEEPILIGFVEKYSIVSECGGEMGGSAAIFDEFRDVFSQEEFPSLPPHRIGGDLSIELMDGKSPPFGPIYSLSRQEEQVLKEYLEGALAAGIIRESKSPAGAPVMFVKKSDGSLRLCVDYRGLNSVTKTNRAALPIIRDLLFRANGSKYFSKIDLKSAFNLIRILEGHEYLTAFRTKYGHFEYLVMPFGLKNAPSTFQSLMNSIFSDLIDRGVLVYIDDILVYTKDRGAHDELLKEVFIRLRRHGLKANPRKCFLFQPQVEFLGHVINEEGVQMDASKVASIRNWAQPKCVKELQSFLGLCNYYRDFIPGFASIVFPLYALTRKDAQFSWNEESQKSFEKIKSVFLSDQVLVQPDSTKQFYLECDASDFAMGAVLSQMNQHGVLRPIGFYSRKFTAAEVNYEIHDKELLAIIEGLKNWRHYCIGTVLPVVVFTDHKNLQYFMSSRQLNRRQARWSLFLADYNFQIVIRPGRQQVVSDALSRQEALQIAPGDVEFNVNEQILLSKDKFIDKERSSSLPDNHLITRDDNLTLAPVQLITPVRNSDSESEEENSDYDVNEYHSSLSDGDVADDYSSDPDLDLGQFMELEGQTESEDPRWFQDLLQYLWNGHLPMVLAPRIISKIKTLSKSFIFKNDRLLKKIVRNGQLYHVPYVPYVDREAVVAKYHTTLGHMQLNTLLPLMEIRYYWPSLSNDISKFQSSCPQCQLNGSITELNHRPLQPHEPVGLPFIKWGIDYVQDLPLVDGFCNIFSARDYATKTVIYVATKDRSAKTAADCIFKHIVCKYGSPLEIVSDRGFMDSVLAEYMKVLEIHHLPTSAYTPRSNGLDERGHQDLKNIITKLSDGDPTKWVKILPLAEFIMNSRISNSTGFSAYYLSHGVEPRLPGDEIPIVPPGFYDLNDAGDVATLTERELARLGQNRAAALQRLKSQAARMKLYYDQKVGAVSSGFKVGDVVKMVNHTRTRFKFRFMGPFYIADIGPNDTYFLMKPDGRRWTSANGTDTPVNPDDLVPFRDHDAEYYYSGN
jgi:hypothetical protein